MERIDLFPKKTNPISNETGKPIKEEVNKTPQNFPTKNASIAKVKPAEAKDPAPTTVEKPSTGSVGSEPKVNTVSPYTIQTEVQPKIVKKASQILKTKPSVTGPDQMRTSDLRNDPQGSNDSIQEKKTLEKSHPAPQQADPVSIQTFQPKEGHKMLKAPYPLKLAQTVLDLSPQEAALETLELSSSMKMKAAGGLKEDESDDQVKTLKNIMTQKPVLEYPILNSSKTPKSLQGHVEDAPHPHPQDVEEMNLDAHPKEPTPNQSLLNNSSSLSKNSKKQYPTKGNIELPHFLYDDIIHLDRFSLQHKVTDHLSNY